MPQDDIDLILKDSSKWAEEFSENVIIKSIPNFLKAKKLGKQLAKDVLDD